MKKCKKSYRALDCLPTLCHMIAIRWDAGATLPDHIDIMRQPHAFHRYPYTSTAPPQPIIYRSDLGTVGQESKACNQENQGGFSSFCGMIP